MNKIKASDLFVIRSFGCKKRYDLRLKFIFHWPFAKQVVFLIVQSSG